MNKFTTALFITPQPFSARPTSLSSTKLSSSTWRPRFIVHHQRPAIHTTTSLPPATISNVLSSEQSTASVVSVPRKTFARGETFSRRRIGLYELKREGVDPSVLLKRSYRFELVYGGIVLSFISIFFIIPVATNTPLREDIISIIIAFLMALYAFDTLTLNGLFQSTIITYFQDNKRVIRHEAAHLLVGHLLGFQIQSVVVPTAKNTFRCKSGNEPKPLGVSINKSWAQSDVYRIAAIGLAGFASELLIYHNAYGVEDDLKQVGQQIKAILNRQEDEQEFGEEDVKHIVRWGLLVATRMIKQHCVAFQKIVDAMTENRDDVQYYLNLIDEHANDSHLVTEPYAAI